MRSNKADTLDNRVCGIKRKGFAGYIMYFGCICAAVLIVLVGSGSAGDSVDCDIQNGSCTQSLQSVQVTLDIQPKPVKAMQDLTFRITLFGSTPGADPYIDLGMPGMNMGPNHVALKAVDAGVYEGTGVIVRCPSGRRIWYARVSVPGLGQVDFTFDVVY